MKALLIGAGMALAAGMSMGFSMQPQLNIGDDRPMGPQQFTAWSADRSTGPFDPATSTYTGYAAELPSYVIGTDWKRATSYAEPVAEPREEPPEIRVARHEEPRAQAQLEAEPMRVSYPSVAGGETYASDLPIAPAPPKSDDEAPTITG